MDERQSFHSWKVHWEGPAGDTGVVYWINPSPGSTMITLQHDLHLGPTDQQPLLATVLEVQQWGTATDIYLREVRSSADALIVVRRRFWWLPAKVRRAEATYRDRSRHRRSQRRSRLRSRLTLEERRLVRPAPRIPARVKRF